jgi:hypothetical protein
MMTGNLDSHIHRGIEHDRGRRMAMARTALSDNELGRLLSLLKGADSVELKLTVPQGSVVLS